MKTYLFSYRYEGDLYSLEMPAESEQEAKDKVRSIQNAEYDGEIAHKAPYWMPASGILVRLLTWFRGL